MSVPESDALSLGEWAVLGLLAARPAHGFALARDLAPEGVVGRVWTVRRPLVYRALGSLQAAGLIAIDRAEEGERGPRRAVYRATREGERVLGGWLARPVEHLRDIRSELMLKLALLASDHRREDLLLQSQLSLLGPITKGLAEKADLAAGFERTLAIWRLESARTVIRFIETLRAGPSQAG